MWWMLPICIIDLYLILHTVTTSVLILVISFSVWSYKFFIEILIATILTPCSGKKKSLHFIYTMCQKKPSPGWNFLAWRNVNRYSWFLAYFVIIVPASKSTHHFPFHSMFTYVIRSLFITIAEIMFFFMSVLCY